MSASATPDRTVPYILAGLTAVFLLMGAVFAAVGTVKDRRIEASRSWPSTEVTIVRQGYTQHYQQGVVTPTEHAFTAIRYTVGGRPFEFVTSGHIPPGTQIFYDPGDPSDSLFAQDRAATGRAFKLVGASCMLVTLPFWYLVYRLLSRSRAVVSPGR